MVYWRPGCPYCMLLRSGLRRTGLAYTETNIWTDTAAAGFVRSVAQGNETVPTVSVGGRALVNPTVREVLDSVAEVDPVLARGTRRPRISERTALVLVVGLVAALFAVLLIW